MKKLEKSDGDKTPKLKLWQLKKSNCDKTQDSKLWQNSIYHKYLEESSSKNNLTPRQRMWCSLGSVEGYFINGATYIQIKKIMSNKLEGVGLVDNRPSTD